MKRFVLIGFLVSALCACELCGQEAAIPNQAPPVVPAAGPPAPAPADAVVVASVSGVAQRLDGANADGKWEPVREGDVLSERTVLRTGFGARVVLRMGDRGEVVVRGGTKAGIARFRRQGKDMQTRMGLKYGAVRIRMNSARGPNDFRVTTPVATLSVRGSGGDASHTADRGTQFESYEGNWTAGSTRTGRSKGVAPGEKTDGDLSDTGDLDDKDADPVVGDPHGGETDDERRARRDNGGGRGPDDFGAASTSTPDTTTTPSTPDTPDTRDGDEGEGDMYPIDGQ
jgi:FecR protein